MPSNLILATILILVGLPYLGWSSQIENSSEAVVAERLRQLGYDEFEPTIDNILNRFEWNLSEDEVGPLVNMLSEYSKTLSSARQAQVVEFAIRAHQNPMSGAVVKYVSTVLAFVGRSTIQDRHVIELLKTLIKSTMPGPSKRVAADLILKSISARPDEKKLANSALYAVASDTGVHGDERIQAAIALMNQGVRVKEAETILSRFLLSPRFAFWVINRISQFPAAARHTSPDFNEKMKSSIPLFEEPAHRLVADRILEVIQRIKSEPNCEESF